MKKHLAFSVALLMAAGALAACGGGNTAPSTAATVAATTAGTTAAATESVANEDPFADPVTLIWYGTGDKNVDGDMVMTAFNEKLKAEYNTTIDYNFTGWDNWENQVNLMLTSGEEIDLMYTGSSTYNRYAKSGAYLDITELFPQYMPASYAYFTADEISDMSVGGRIYGIPSGRHGYIPTGIYYRKDLADKHNLAPITSLETFETYMDGIKANEPDITPYAGNPDGGMSGLFRYLNGFEAIQGTASHTILVKGYDDIENIVSFPFTDEYVEWCKRMKDYAGRGYWSSNALSATMSTWDAIQVGASAVSIENPEGVAWLTVANSKAHPEFEFDYWNFVNITGYVQPNPIMQDAFSLPKSAKNPERCLRILEIIKTDASFYDLFMYGIEGHHYSLTDDGKLIVPAEGQDPAAVSNYDAVSLGWAMRVEALERTNVAQWEGFASLMDQIRSMSVRNKFGGAILDYADVQAEFAAITQVAQQYGLPLNVGLVADVDAAVDEYRTMLTSAGIDKMLEVVKAQMLAYYAEKGIQ